MSGECVVGVCCECTYHGATGESIEHVEEDETSEGHGRVPWSDHLVLHLRIGKQYSLCRISQN